MVYENGRAPWKKLGGCCGNSEKAGWLRRKLYRDTILYRTRRPSQRGGTIQHGPNLRLVFHNLDPGGASAHSDPRPLSALATPSQERQSIAIRDDMTGIDEHEDAHLTKTITPCSRCGSPLPPSCAVPTATRVPPGTATPLSRMHERGKDAIDAGDMEGRRGRRQHKSLSTSPRTALRTSLDPPPVGTAAMRQRRGEKHAQGESTRRGIQIYDAKAAARNNTPGVGKYQEADRHSQTE